MNTQRKTTLPDDAHLDELEKHGDNSNMKIEFEDEPEYLDDRHNGWADGDPAQDWPQTEEDWSDSPNFGAAGYRLSQPVQPLRPVQLILPAVAVIILLVSALGVWNRQRFILDGVTLPTGNGIQDDAISLQSEAPVEQGEQGEPAANLAEQTSFIAPFFEDSVRYWEADIIRWGERHNLDPNMVATIMQIESCGAPQAVSKSDPTTVKSIGLERFSVVQGL